MSDDSFERDGYDRRRFIIGGAAALGGAEKGTCGVLIKNVLRSVTLVVSLT
jgi:hypothetical protein